MSERLNVQTAAVLRAGTVIGISVLAVGLLLSAFDISEYILTAGAAVLIFTPMAGVAVSAKCLWQEGDRRWTSVAIILIIAVAAGMVLAFAGL